MTAASPLGTCLLAKLREAFPEREFVEPVEPHVLVSIHSPHPDVGRLDIDDDGDELTAHIGRFAHAHLGGHDDLPDGPARHAAIADDVVAWLRELFADRIEFYGTGRAGGWGIRSGKRRGWLSRWVFGARTYVWSGPLDPGA